MEKNKSGTDTEAKGEAGVTSLPIKPYGDENLVLTDGQSIGLIIVCICVCGIIPSGLKQDDSSDIMSDEGREKWGPWMSHLYFPVNGDLRAGEGVLFFGSYRVPGIPPEFCQ